MQKLELEDLAAEWLAGISLDPIARSNDCRSDPNQKREIEMIRSDDRLMIVVSDVMLVQIVSSVVDCKNWEREWYFDQCASAGSRIRHGLDERAAADSAPRLLLRAT